LVNFPVFPQSPHRGRVPEDGLRFALAFFLVFFLLGIYLLLVRRTLSRKIFA
jgi:hypothetical protein